MSKAASLAVGVLIGISLAWGLARLIYHPISHSKPASLPTAQIENYIAKQKQTISSLNTGEFDAKASQQLEQFMSDAITMTDTAKNSPKHPEMQQFARDSTYSWGYNLEGVKIIEENLGLRPKHGSQHCDSVGSC